MQKWPGEMVRFMAERGIENPADIQKFNRLGYRFREDLSSEKEYILNGCLHCSVVLLNCNYSC